MNKQKLLEAFEEASKDFTIRIENNPSHRVLCEFSHEVLYGFEVYKEINNVNSGLGCGILWMVYGF